ncbi:hypothetical protein F5888DRAFT_1191709 [Russula emetica]|nr:hypothetical protein F5888DRAFT_1191709 [Russula emetica]
MCLAFKESNLPSPHLGRRKASFAGPFLLPWIPYERQVTGWSMILSSRANCVMRKDAQKAEDQYTRLLTTLCNAGLYAVGRRSEHQGQLILLVSCSGHQLQLLQRERHLDVLHGLLTCGSDIDPGAINSAERLRLVDSYVTATPSDGGLGIHPDNDVWSRIESIIALHDPEFNDRWIHSVTKPIDIGHSQLDIIRSQVRASIPNHVVSPHTCSSETPSLYILLSWFPTLITSSLFPSLAS